MVKAQIRVGEEYALRERPVPGTALQRVRVIQRVRQKWKVVWIEPNPGLTDYVESVQLIAPWGEHEAFLKEEDSRRRLRQYNKNIGYREDSALTRAVEQVFESASERVSFWQGGILYGTPEAFERLKARAAVEFKSPSRFRYTDRRGEIRLPFDEAMEIAKAF